jgi:hypothetical protein
MGSDHTRRALYQGITSAQDVPQAARRPAHSNEERGEDMALEQIGVTRWLGLIQAEYREMPDLRLNKSQMQRLWGFDAFVCDALVDALIAAHVLKRTACGRYVTNRVAH